jgi:hypothetical protein
MEPRVTGESALKHTRKLKRLRSSRGYVVIYFL